MRRPSSTATGVFRRRNFQQLRSTINRANASAPADDHRSAGSKRSAISAGFVDNSDMEMLICSLSSKPVLHWRENDEPDLRGKVSDGLIRAFLGFRRSRAQSFAQTAASCKARKCSCVHLRECLILYAGERCRVDHVGGAERCVIVPRRHFGELLLRSQKANEN